MTRWVQAQAVRAASTSAHFAIHDMLRRLDAATCHPWHNKPVKAGWFRVVPRSWDDMRTRLAADLDIVSRLADGAAFSVSMVANGTMPVSPEEFAVVGKYLLVAHVLD